LLKAKPAVLVRRPALKSKSQHQPGLDSGAANPSPERSANFPPAAEPRPAPDDRGESDYAFFTKRPGLNQRFRFAFPDELFPVGVIALSASAFVIITIQRDDDGWPKRRAKRHLRFCERGHA
jgi:hypothetical protein